ncbi:MAG: SMI1/KNR4 family protein [Planctomycetota bacterium]
MTENEVVEIESAFGCKLPHAYRHLLLEPPEMLVALMNAYALENSDLEVPFFVKAEAIAASNQEVRDPENGIVYDEEDESAMWPSEYFVIGGDCGGNMYCIQPASGVSTVFEWDHSGGDNFEKCADTMKEYVKLWFKELGVIAAMDCEDDLP